MKEYKFEYTKTGMLIFIAIVSFILAIAIALLPPDLGLVLGVNLNAIIGLTAGILTIYLTRKNYQKGAAAILSDQEVIFMFEGIVNNVQFQNLQYYKIEYGNGISYLSIQSLSLYGKITRSIVSIYFIFSVLWFAWIMARFRKRA